MHDVTILRYLNFVHLNLLVFSCSEPSYDFIIKAKIANVTCGGVMCINVYMLLKKVGRCGVMWGKNS